MITPKNLVRHELIGLEAKIISSANREVVGLEGKVIDETRNMIILDIKGKKKSFAKTECVFSFRLPSGWVKVDGKLLVARPEDRIKKKLKRW